MEVSKTTGVDVKDTFEERSFLDSTKNVPEEVGFDTEEKEENDVNSGDAVKDSFVDTTVDTMTPAEAIFSQNSDIHATNSVKVRCLLILLNRAKVSRLSIVNHQGIA